MWRVCPASAPAPPLLLLLVGLALFCLLPSIAAAQGLGPPKTISISQLPPHIPPQSYLDEVCKPPTLHVGDVVPPCVAVEVTEQLCVANGTSQLYLEAHAQCMCRGSYFAEWTGCRTCLSLHGLLSDPTRLFYQSVLSSASSSLCGFLTVPAVPLPTATFRELFKSVEAGMPVGPPADTSPGSGYGGGDRAISRTEVSLYYTPSGPQGPGTITGSAALATATGFVFATGSPSFDTGGPRTTITPTALRSGASGSSSPPGTSTPGPAQTGSAVSSVTARLERALLLGLLGLAMAVIVS